MFEIVYRYNPDATASPSRPENAEQARTRLIRGNQLFVNLLRGSLDSSSVQQEVIPIDLSDLGVSRKSTGVPRQQPFAAVLSCSDARVPVELIFNQAYNDLFVVRLAGNVVSSECIGSIGYAIRNLDDSVKLAVVLGHTCCGAVTGAVDSYIKPLAYPEITAEFGMRSVIDRVFVSVRSAAQALEGLGISQASDETSFREKLIEISVVLNSALMAMTLNQIISEVVSVDCSVVYGVYDLSSQIVWAPDITNRARPWAEPRLADPPTSLKEFEKLAAELASLFQTEPSKSGCP